MSTKPKTAAVFQFRPRDDGAAEAALAMPYQVTPAATSTEERPQAIDLSGRPKVWFTIGRGRVGKTHLIRWAAEVAEARGQPPLCAAADPVNRTLRVYRSDVAEPPSGDPAAVVEWLQELLQFTMKEKTSALIDLGGGETSLFRLLAIMPDLADVMEGEGVTPVAMHVVGPDPHDLTPLAMMETAGFRPRATATVCNLQGVVRADFSRVLRHTAMKAALDRGAVQLWMPNLTKDAARQVDAHCLQFHDADRHLGPFARSSVRTWLAAMGQEFDPIKTWLP